MQQSAVLPARARTFHSSLAIAAMGTYVPERRLTNDDLAQMVDTDDAWIVRRTGIRERHITRPDEFTSDMCFAAVRDLEARGGSLDEVDYLVACTVTPDYRFPSVAARLQDRLGLRRVGAVDIGAGCAGFVYGLDYADALVATGRARKVLVVAGETLSKITDYTDRATCVLFGDGAGAALVGNSDDPQPTVLARRINSDGAAGRELYCTGLRTDVEGVIDPKPLLRQNGRAVYEWVLKNVSAGVGELLAQRRAEPGRRRLVRSAQREPAHDRGDLQAHRDPAGAHADQHRVVRQHLDRVDPARARAGARRRPRQARRHRAALRLRRRPGGVRPAAALVLIQRGAGVGAFSNAGALRPTSNTRSSPTASMKPRTT